ncbi:MAG: hypothetical protein HY726_06785 [Candidatus Rokubacteria bacterium]|nr:hypothetical protein [Candidatus Rokubacteria bacterium]
MIRLDDPLEGRYPPRIAMESALVRALRTIDGQRLARHLETRDEYARAFPLFFRAIAHEACAHLWEQFPGATAFVGEDCRGEAAVRYPHLARLPLDWVAFAFEGVVMWDLHIGVVTNLARHRPAIQVGVHTTPPLWPRLAPMLEALDWQALVGEKLALNEARVIGEIQLVEPARPLIFADLAGEVFRLAERVARYYAIVAPLPVEAGIVPRS